jgi:hypothetical protein
MAALVGQRTDRAATCPSRNNYSLLRCLQQSPSVLPRWDKAAAVVEAAAERPEVPVALVEQQAQLAQRQQAPPMWVRRLAAA